MNLNMKLWLFLYLVNARKSLILDTDDQQKNKYWMSKLFLEFH